MSSSSRRGLADPFASLETGAYGADVCVHRDDIDQEFANEDLHLVRVRVDENRDLRRVETDAFVRNVVNEDPGSDAAFLKAMLSDIPGDAREDEVMVSALLHETIPPVFVRLDGPDDENIVTRVMDLDVGVSKLELLISLGRVASQDDFTDEDLATMEGALETLKENEDRAGIDAYIEERFL